MWDTTSAIILLQGFGYPLTPSAETHFATQADRIASAKGVGYTPFRNPQSKATHAPPRLTRAGKRGRGLARQCGIPHRRTFPSDRLEYKPPYREPPPATHFPALVRRPRGVRYTPLGTPPRRLVLCRKTTSPQPAARFRVLVWSCGIPHHHPFRCWGVRIHTRPSPETPTKTLPPLKHRRGGWGTPPSTPPNTNRRGRPPYPPSGGRYPPDPQFPRRGEAWGVGSKTPHQPPPRRQGRGHPGPRFWGWDTPPDPHNFPRRQGGGDPPDPPCNGGIPPLNPRRREGDKARGEYPPLKPPQIEGGGIHPPVTPQGKGERPP